MKKQILELRKLGKTYNEIIKELGCSKSTVAYYCGEGQKLKTHQRGKKRRRLIKDWIQEYKESMKCKECGESRWWCLDFHHRDPSSKEHTVAHLVRTASAKRIKEEIKKCDVLCANCHRDLHYRID